MYLCDKVFGKVNLEDKKFYFDSRFQRFLWSFGFTASTSVARQKHHDEGYSRGKLLISWKPEGERERAKEQGAGDKFYHCNVMTQ